MEKVIIEESSQEEIHNFDFQTWREEDIDNYGEAVGWKEKSFVFKALLDGKIIGSATGAVQAGVIFLDALIVARECRKMGVGKMIMDKILDWSKPLNPHKIMLFTMSSWQACKFYRQLGFKKEGDLPNHYLKRPFIILAKYLKVTE
jgi:ribosomal protein S18 acetylase RimI-like enzyme